MQAAQGDAVQNSAPLAVAAAIEAIGVLETQERLGLAIAGLLTQIGPRVLTSMMPDECARSESDPISCLLQPPAQIDVVTGLAVSRVETVELQQDFPSKRHITTGNVFRDLIAFQHVGGLAG